MWTFLGGVSLFGLFSLSLYGLMIDMAIPDFLIFTFE